MTTLFEEKETCFVCGKTHKYTEIGSTNQFGSPDLDTRPPEMARSTIDCWIRCCPYCGYCAPALSKDSPQAKSIVKSEEYRQQLDNKAYPKLAKHFLCWAMIQEATGDYSTAGWAAVHAAWACDDQNAQEASRLCRLKAIQLFQEANGASNLSQTGAQEALMADLLRRSGQFDQVENVCQEGLKQNPEKIIQQILTFQMTLARQQDKECHRVDEIEPGSAPD